MHKEALTMPGDDPAVAQDLVDAASRLCEQEDHLWDVIQQLSIPTDRLTDTRDQDDVDFHTDEMVRAYLYLKVRNLSYNEFADQLAKRPSLYKSLGFDNSDADNPPTQQTFSYIWGQFGDGTKPIIEAAAEGLRLEAVEHGVVAESLVPTPPEDQDDDEKPDKAYKKEKSQKTIRLARRHAFPEFDTGRAPHRIYEDRELFDMFARMCNNQGSAHSEGEYGYLTDHDLTCNDKTFLRAIKKAATPEDMDAQLTFDDFTGSDSMPAIERIRSEVMEAFDGATNNVLNTIKGEDPFDDRKTIAAIDFTHEQFHVYPWEDKDEGIPKADYPRMVSGYKKDNTIKRGYKYATITLVGENAPIILGVEPVKENSKWEDDDAASFSKGDIVARLLDKAQQFVDLDEVFLDRGFYANDVYAEIHDRGLLYTCPVPKYEEDYQNIKDIQEHPSAEMAVNHDVPFGYKGEVHHEAEFMYLPSTSDDADGKYAVFVTNRDRVEPEEIKHVCGRYRRRWDIENQYKNIKDFLPKTSSTDYRVRLIKFALSAVIYNLWRLTDYLIKQAIGVDVRAPPELTAKTFVRALGDFLRDIG